MATKTARQTRTDLLGPYLNDHLAGATTGAQAAGQNHIRSSRQRGASRNANSPAKIVAAVAMVARL